MSPLLAPSTSPARCHRSLLSSAICVFVVCGHLTGWGGEEKAETERVLRLSPIVVQASPIVDELRLDAFSGKISSVTDEQIEALSAHDLADALRRVPGVSISRYNPVGAYGGGQGGSFTIRGHGWERPGGSVAVRVDGVARFNGMWTHPLLDTIAIDTAERIDVYKSPQPVLFGNMAFGAVDLTPKRHTEEGFNTRASTQYGSYETMVHKLEHGGKIKRFDYLISAVHRSSDGHRTNADGEAEALYANLGYTLSPHWDLSLRVTHTEAHATDPRATNAPAIPRSEVYHTDTEMYALTLSHKHDRANGTMKAYYEDGWAKWEQWDDNNTPNDPNDDFPLDHYPPWENYGLHARESITLFDGNTTTIGAEYDVIRAEPRYVNPDSGNVSNRLDETFRRLAPYLRISQRIDAEPVVLTPSAGVRWTRSRHFDDELSYQAGITAELGANRFYANAARAVNYPGMYAAMFYENFWSSLGNPDGWKELDSETMDHWEIGMTRRLTEACRIDVSYYHATIRDALRLHLPPPPPPQWQNIGDYTSEGVEASIEFTAADNLSCFAGINYNHTSGANVPRAPEWTGSAGVNYTPVPRITIHLDAEYTDEQHSINTRKTGELAKPPERIDDFTLLNARISYAFAPADQDDWAGEFFLSIKNLADEDYEYHSEYPMPGTNVHAGVKLEF